MPSTWIPKTSEEVTAELSPLPSPPPPQQQTCCALPWPYPHQPTESLAARRERIATEVLAGLAANAERSHLSIGDDVDLAVEAADRLIRELDKEGER